MSSPNVSAFLTMVARSEGTEKPWIVGRDAYRICFLERHVIASLATHPAASGEWIGADGKPGEIITEGKYAGEHSTAAGRYQINLPTFERLGVKLRTRSFVPEAQDDMAVELLKEADAFRAINAGDLHTAIFNCSPIWASLPYSGAGQHTQLLGSLFDMYTAAGGSLV